jgi:geranylgeranyl reductase
VEKHDVIIVGGGPGGLACAERLAGAGAGTLLLERKKSIGAKVCAGGITWQGLIRRVPEKLIERTFNEQHIFSGLQSFSFRRDNPVIATVDRRKLGGWMMEQAGSAGADIRAGWHVRAVDGSRVTATDPVGRTVYLEAGHLVGADGSSSLVRRSLGLPVGRIGMGINYQVAGHRDHMEWHLNTRYFGNGYGWIFPHRDTVSVGAYASSREHPRRLQKMLLRWSRTRTFSLAEEQGRAELINYDYQGHRFGTTWLVGDAAGLASGLTGEGIQPAIVSGLAVAGQILAPAYPAPEIEMLLAKKRRHELLVRMTGRSRTACTSLMEMLILMIRLQVVDFEKQLSM